MSRQQNCDTPLVAIQCLVYNHEKYLRDCLDGFIMQKTNFKFVAIVHDDVSTDNSVSIIKEYEEKYPDIIKPIYEKENQYSKGGFAKLQHIMFTACSATGVKYIAVCEGDDYWTNPYKLQKQVDILEGDINLIGSFTNRCIVNKDGEVIEQRSYNLAPKNGSKTYSIRTFFTDNPMFPTASVIFRTGQIEDVLRKMDYVANKYLGDWTLWIILLSYGDFYYLDEVTVAYRINPTSITHTYDRVGRAKASYEICKKVADVLPLQYSDIAEDLRVYLWHIMPISHAYRKEHMYLHAFWYTLISFFKSPSYTVKWFWRIIQRHINPFRGN